MAVKFVVFVLLVQLNQQTNLTSGLSQVSSMMGSTTQTQQQPKEELEVLEEDPKPKGPPPINMGKELELEKEEGSEYYFEGQSQKDKFIEDRMLDIKRMGNQIDQLKSSLQNKLDNLKALVDDSVFRSRSFKMTEDSINFI